MPESRRLLVVHHTVSPATETLLASALEGARHPAITGVEVVVRPALVAGAVEALEADGYLLGSPVNIGYVSGALKHFFDTIYYPCLEATVGRPFGLWLHAGGDAAGALRAVQAITAGLRWRAAQPPVIVTGTPSDADRAAVREMAAAVAAGLMPD
ncbi:MAG TPA: NAD(P)H-dependent oxidoreductase [Acidimicrobiales bacterium]|nr:NAD(P)H-dependent oxidoreductase [Acidimicrobiales bacterium]